MLAAAHLLVQEQSVKVTALTLGYSRTNNFSREFHRVHSLSGGGCLALGGNGL